MAKKPALHLSFGPETKVDQAGDTVTLSTTATIMGREVNKLHDNDAIQLTFKMEFDASKIAKKGPPASGGKSSWSKALVKGVITEGAKEMVKDIIGLIFQSERLPQSK